MFITLICKNKTITGWNTATVGVFRRVDGKLPALRWIQLDTEWIRYLEFWRPQTKI